MNNEYSSRFYFENIATDEERREVFDSIISPRKDRSKHKKRDCRYFPTNTMGRVGADGTIRQKCENGKYITQGEIAMYDRESYAYGLTYDPYKHNNIQCMWAYNSTKSGVWKCGNTNDRQKGRIYVQRRDSSLLCK